MKTLSQNTLKYLQASTLELSFICEKPRNKEEKAKRVPDTEYFGEHDLILHKPQVHEKGVTESDPTTMGTVKLRGHQ